MVLLSLYNRNFDPVVNHDEIMNSFPILSEEDLGDLTFGKKVYSESYAQLYRLHWCFSN
jgi:hypothetical protein